MRQKGGKRRGKEGRGGERRGIRSKIKISNPKQRYRKIKI